MPVPFFLEVWQDINFLMTCLHRKATKLNELKPFKQYSFLKFILNVCCFIPWCLSMKETFAFTFTFRVFSRGFCPKQLTMWTFVTRKKPRHITVDRVKKGKMALRKHKELEIISTVCLCVCMVCCVKHAAEGRARNFLAHTGFLGCHLWVCVLYVGQAYIKAIGQSTCPVSPLSYRRWLGAC